MRRLALMLHLVLLSSACGSDIECSVDKDCFQGEVCLGEICVETTPPGSTNSSNNTNTNNTPKTNNHVTPVNNVTEGSYTELKAEYPTSQCIVDTFEPCSAPDDNESFATYLKSGNGAGGCLRDDEINVIDFTSTLEICTRETKDRYYTNLSSCRSKSFVVEIFFTPKVKCDTALYTFNARVGDQSCDDPSETFRCTLKPDGSWHVQGVVAPSRTVLSAYVEITPNFGNVVDFEYDLRFLTRE